MSSPFTTGIKDLSSPRTKTSTTTKVMTSPRIANKTLKESEETEDCSLCLKTFTNPKILPCFHTYCLKCLQSYVEANAHNQKFACPLCAFECVIPPGGVGDLQTNFYIKAAQTKSNIAANSPCEVKFLHIMYRLCFT